MSLVITILFLAILLGVRSLSFLDSLSRKLLTFYIVVWWYTVFFSRLQLYGMIPIDESVTWLLIIHVVTFVIGYTLCASNNGVKKISLSFSKELLDYEVKRIMNSKWFIILLLLLTAYVLGKLVVFYQQVVVLSAIDDLRDSYYEGKMYGSDFVLMNSLLLSPMNVICSVLWSYALFRKRNWVFVVMTVFLFANNSLVGGRIGYAFIMFVLLLIVVLPGIKVRKYIPIILVVFLGVYFILSFVTAARFEGDATISISNLKENGFEETNKQIVLYTTGPVAAFNVSLEEHFSERIGGYKYGGLVGASILHLAYMVLNKLGLPFHQPIFDYSDLIQDQWISIGPTGWNALYTSANFYYLDSGVLGVILYPFIFGLIFCWAVKLFFKTQSIWHLFLLSFVWQMVCFSIMNFNFTSSFSLIMCLVFYYLGKKNANIITVVK